MNPHFCFEINEIVLLDKEEVCWMCGCSSDDKK